MSKRGRGGTAGNKFRMSLGLPVAATVNCADNTGRRSRRITSRDSESEGSQEEVRRDRHRRREGSDANNRERASRRREEKGDHESRDLNLGGDSKRDDRRRSRRSNEGEENEHENRKNDKGREKKLQHNEANEDHKKVEHRRHRDYSSEDDKTGYKDRVQDSYQKSESDRRNRNRRSEREREDEEEEGEYRGRNKNQRSERKREDDVEEGEYRGSKRNRRSEREREDDKEEGKHRVREGRYSKYDDREDDRKERQRDGKRERERRLDDNGDKHDMKSEKHKKGSEDASEGLNTRGDVKESVALNVQNSEWKVGIDAIANLGRSGGVYIPPFKLARMMKDIEDKSSVEYQRMTWDALRKSINGLVNKINATNIKNIIPELFAENLIRGRGLFCRSCMKSQMASPGFTDVFAALVAVVNTKFPEVGDLLLRRIILQLQRAYKRNDKPQLPAAVKFIAHLANQQVVHELIALELLTLLLEKPTDDSVEVAVGFVTECGSLLQDLSPRGLHGIFERFRGILHEGEIDKRVHFS